MDEQLKIFADRYAVSEKKVEAIANYIKAYKRNPEVWVPFLLSMEKLANVEPLRVAELICSCFKNEDELARANYIQKLQEVILTFNDDGDLIAYQEIYENGYLVKREFAAIYSNDPRSEEIVALEFLNNIIEKLKSRYNSKS